MCGHGMSLDESHEFEAQRMLKIVRRDQVEPLRCQLTTMTERAEKAEGIVDKLPKTADGVVIVPGMSLFETWQSATSGIRSLRVDCWCDDEDAYPIPPGAMYSTREAAKAAKE